MSLLTLTTVTSALALQRTGESERDDHAAQHATDVAGSLRQKLDSHTDVLFAVRSMMGSGSALDHQQFADLVGSLEVDRRFPRVQVVGYAPLVSRDDATFEPTIAAGASQGTLGYPEFDIHPDSVAPQLLPIAFVHPVAGNEMAFGFDLSSEPTRRRAADRARDTGLPAATAPIALVQDPANEPAFLIMVPAYTTPETPGTVAGRRAAFAGVAYAAFRMGDLVTTALPAAGGGVLEIYDVGEFAAGASADRPARSNEIYSTGETLVAPSQSADTPSLTDIDIAGRRWRVYAGTTGNESILRVGLPWVALIDGLLLTLLVVGVLHTSDRARRANLTKNRFLSRMSHELRTPLNAVIGFAQVLQLDDLDESQVECATQIEIAGKHLLGLIDEVLEVSRIEAGDLPLSTAAVSLDEVLRRVANLMEPLAVSAAVGIRAPSPTGITLVADDKRLTQVLLNLASNAIKYNTTGGTISLTAAPAGNHRARIGVHDNGPGMSPDQLGRLFIPFERLGAETTDVEGIGLGLVVSRMLVEAMGGRLEVDSTEGIGSTFWVDLPTIDAETAVTKRKAIRAATGSVLCIEDNPANLLLFERIVAQRPGVELHIATSGRAGVRAALDVDPDLIFLDLNLLDDHGREVMAQIRAGQTRPTPIVIVSADATSASAQKLLADGADGYLPKPLEVRSVLALIDSSLAARPLEAVTT